MADELVKVAEDSARGGFFLVFGTALSTVIMAVSAILIGWFLGAEQYGRYTVAVILPSLLFLLADLGINQGITKFSASLNARGETGRLFTIVKRAMLLKAAVGIMLFAANYVLADQIGAFILQRPDLGPEVRIASISVLFQVIFAIATSAFVGLDKTEYNVLATNLQALAKTIISIVLVLLGFGVAGALIGFVASYVVAAAASALLLLFFLRGKQAAGDGHSFSDDVGTLMKYGAPLYAALLLTGCIPLLQNYVLALFTTDTEIGNYKVATNFATLMTILSFPIATMLLPAFAKIDSSAIEKIRTFFKMANKYTTMMVVPVAMLMIVYSDEIIHIVYQSKFQSAPAYLAAYSLVYLLVGLGSLTTVSFFNGLGETRATLLVSLTAFLALLGLSPMLANAYGVIGMLAAFIVASTLSTLCSLYIARARFQVEFAVSSLLKIYGVATISLAPSLALLYSGVIRQSFSAIAPSFLLRLGFLPELIDFAAGVLLYLFIYLTLTPLTGIVTKPELQMASRVIRRVPGLSIVGERVLKYMKNTLNRRTKKQVARAETH